MIKYSDYLKHSFPLYIISGVILGIAVFLLIMVQRYDNYLSDTLVSIKNISTNKHRIEKQLEEINNLKKYFEGNFGMDINAENSERLIFQALDNIKMNFGDVLITVAKFDKKQGGKVLPVEIRASGKDYKKITEYVRFIESFRIPKYKIRNVSISRSQAGEIIFNIKGALVMPAL